MSEHETAYTFMTGRDFVRMMGHIRGVPDLDAATERAIALVDLTDAADRPMGTYSRGMRQRMRLAATLVHDPDVLILDEPLNGADHGSDFISKTCYVNWQRTVARLSSHPISSKRWSRLPKLSYS